MSTSRPVMHRLHIDNLPAATRARLIATIDASRHRDGVGGPILANRVGVAPLVAATAVVVMAVAALVPVVAEATRDRASAATPVALAALLAAAGAIVGVVIRRLAALGRSPLPPGVYVIQSDLIDARRPLLRVTSMASTRVDAVHQHLGGLYLGSVITIRAGGAGWRFVVRGRRDADARLSAIRTALVAFLSAVQRQDLATLERIDPFFAARMSGRWGRDADTAPIAGGSRWRRLLAAPLLLAVAAAGSAPVVSWLLSPAPARDDGGPAPCSRR